MKYIYQDYSPGPWVISIEKDGGYRISSAISGKIICRVEKDGPALDPCLIATSTEMLETLQYIFVLTNEPNIIDATERLKRIRELAERAVGSTRWGVENSLAAMALKLASGDE